LQDKAEASDLVRELHKNFKSQQLTWAAATYALLSATACEGCRV